jgi:putative ABC transport system substrate-binding protein
MRRREFIAAVSAAAAWPLPTRSQQWTVPVVGFLRSTSLSDADHLVTAFPQGLKDAGFSEGQNVAIEFRSAENRLDRLSALAVDLVRRPVNVIVADNLAAPAAKSATTTVPIVFAGGGDPVKEGLVASLSRPGTNVTGVNFFTGVIGTKRLELLRQLVPKAAKIGVLIYPKTPQTEAERTDLQTAARAIGQQLVILDRAIEAAFVTFAKDGVDAVLTGSGPFMNSHREKLVAFAAQNRLPASYTTREAAIAGGLMSYGTSLTDALRQAGIYAGLILKGEKPANIPVVQSTRFELVINLKTAKALGIAVSPTLVAIADEVIE